MYTPLEAVFTKNAIRLQFVILSVVYRKFLGKKKDFLEKSGCKGERDVL